MSLQKLPEHVQSIFSASFQICSYKRAIEELVFNALDADSTSIAIRINIVENTIQVIDNGCGISKKNFALLGQKHATSKCMDLSILKSVPNKYGFRGLALSSIINISESVNITSRYKESGKTFIKYYFKGKEINIIETSLRPSKGTTVDIRGFLYNLKIQKKAVNALIELNNIKLFLEQLSLLQNNISLSLRDDAKNEILFKIHKNRDIYQTLSSAYGIHKNEIQELKVEKNEYKVTAYMAKKYIEITPKHWIYLNGKVLSNSKIHNIVNDNLNKYLKITSRGKARIKSNRIYDEEEANKHNTIPTYFLFLNCPYYDYDISYNLKQTTAEFKNWEQVTKLLEKLIKFYIGDKHVKEMIHAVGKEIVVNKKDNDTRDQVKKIMDKILGCNTKKIGTLQMQKGIKGKLTKRKLNNNSRKLTLTKVMNNLHLNQSTKSKRIKPAIENCNKNDENMKTNTKITFTRQSSKTVMNANKNELNTFNKNHINSNQRYSKHEQSKTKKLEPVNCKKFLKRKANQSVQTTKVNLIKYSDPILDKFEQDPTGSIKRRCNALSKKVENLLNQQETKNHEIFVNETVHYSNITKDNKNYSIRKKIDEIIIHDYIPLRTTLNQIPLKYKMDSKNRKLGFVCSHDLLKTILNTQDTKKKLFPLSDNTISKKTELTSVLDNNDRNFILDSFTFHCSSTHANLASHDEIIFPKFTYDSHNYKTVYNSQNRYRCNVKDASNFIKKPKIFQFMSTKSKDNFITLDIRPKRQIKNHMKAFRCRSRHGFLKKNLYNSNCNESCTIEFSRNSGNTNNNFFDIQQVDSVEKSISTNEFCTYTIEHDNRDNYGCTYTLNQDHLTYDDTLHNYQNIYDDVNDQIFLKESTRVDNLTYDDTFHNYQNIYDDNNEQNFSKENTKIVFISKSQEEPPLLNETLNPLNICETELNASDNMLQNTQLKSNTGKDSLFKDEFDLESQFWDSNIFSPRPTCLHIGSTRENELTMENDITNNDEPKFTLKNRPRFVPKGMSQIFRMNRIKPCDSKYSSNYFEKTIYCNFIEDIKSNAEIYEPVVQNVKDWVTKAIGKVRHKLKKDNAALIFDGFSLKHAKVLGQLDSKFIAAKMKNKDQKHREYLVLFDQHAVHERIRLENYVKIYFDGELWKSVTLKENLHIKLSKDDLLYLHNYEDKFKQLGLQWTIEDDENVLVKGIPEAIMGKNERQAEIIMKAVRSLFLEEIASIKLQSGCITMYPKAIMDLVFSEACRYAYKFGDKLYMDDCVLLLQSLSECKTPFQCAHGRPVMAVILDIKEEKYSYKVDLQNIRKWKNVQKQ